MWGLDVTSFSQVAHRILEPAEDEDDDDEWFRDWMSRVDVGFGRNLLLASGPLHLGPDEEEDDGDDDEWFLQWMSDSLSGWMIP